MNDTTNYLLSLCAQRSQYLKSGKELYDKVLDSIKKKDLSDNLKKQLLVELYRYSFYEGAQTGPDVRGDNALKVGILSSIEKAANGEESELDNAKKANDILRNFIDAPDNLIKALDWGKDKRF
jgi:hypothetical protein